MFGSKKNNPPIQTLVGADTVVRGDVAFKGGRTVHGTDFARSPFNQAWYFASSMEVTAFVSTTSMLVKSRS